MDSVKSSALTPWKGRFARTVSKVLHLRGATGIAPVDGIQKVKSGEVGIQKPKSREIGIQKLKSREFGVQKVKSQEKVKDEEPHSFEVGIQKLKSGEIGIQKLKSREFGVQKVKLQEKVKDEEPQSFEVGIQKLKSGEIGIQKLKSGEIGIQKLKSGEIGIQKLKSGEFGIQKVKSRQKVKDEEPQSFEVGIQKLKSGEIGIQKLKSEEIGIQKLKSEEIGIQKLKSEEIGIQKLKSGEFGIQKLKSGEFGIQKLKSGEFGIQKVKSQQKVKDEVEEIGIQKLKSEEIGIQKLKSEEIGIQKLKSGEFGIQKVKSQQKVKDEEPQSFDINDEELQDRVILAKLFASVSTVKAAYAQLQFSQSPYDSDGIQAADQVVVAEFKKLSEMKQCYLKRQFDSSPETAMILAEIEEQKSVAKTYEIMGKKLESQVRLKNSEIIFLKEKLEEANKENKLVEKKLNQSGQLYVLDKLHLSGLSSSHFITVLRYTLRSIRSFVRMMIDEMKSAGWDFDAAACAIQPDVVYGKQDDKCFAFESFLCREMFGNFCYPYFSLPIESLKDKGKQQQELFFRTFMELKPMKPKEYLSQKPKSAFSSFCRVKYLQLIHPNMESSFFGNLNQRNLIINNEFPSNPFFASFAEMSKRVFLLHCLAFSFQKEASIFQVRKGCRFSDVYMESIVEEALPSTMDHALEYDPQVAFTVVPGFMIGKTVIQCQVYVSQFQNQSQKLKVVR